MSKSVMQLKRGNVVEAVLVPAFACNVRIGELGVVYEEAGASRDEAGPMVRWVESRTSCKVEDGWVKVVH